MCIRDRLLGTAVLAAAAASAASAQGILDQLFGLQNRGATASGVVLFEGVNFSGRSIQVSGEERDFANLNFDNRARSLVTDRPVSVCSDRDFRSCRDLQPGRYADLARLGIAGSISSVRSAGVDAYGSGGGYGSGGYGGGAYGSGGYGESGYGGGYGRDRDNDGDDRQGYDRPAGGYGAANRDGVEGRTAVFFPRPTAAGRVLAARGRPSADQFCRAAGYSASIYFSQGERNRAAVDTDGRVVDAPVLRDVLCSR